jgi:hypothetical protein
VIIGDDNDGVEIRKKETEIFTVQGIERYTGTMN